MTNETITRIHFDPSRLGEPSCAALRALSTLSPGTYRRANLTSVLSAVSGITRKWAEEMIRWLCRDGAIDSVRAGITIDPDRIKRQWPAFDFDTNAITLHIDPLEDR